MKLYKINNKLISNWLYLILSTSLTSIFSFLCYIIIGRKMSVDDYGIFSALLALATMVAVYLNNIISSTVVNRELAIKPTTARDVFKMSFSVRVMILIFASICLYIYESIVDSNTIIINLSIIMLLSFETLWDLFEQIAFGLKMTKYSTIINITSALLWFIVILIMPISAMSVKILFPIYALICFLKAIIYGGIDYSITRWKTSKANIRIKYLFIQSMPYLYMRAISTVSAQIPILLLGGYSTVAEVAYYSIGEKFTIPIMKITSTMINAVFPFLTKALINNRDKATKIIVQLFSVILSFGGCIALLLASTSDYWLIAIMGKKYINATDAFNYQIWFTVILSLDTIFAMILSSDYKQKMLAIVTTIDVVVLLPFLYFNISSGSKGLAIAKLIAACICMIYHLAIISHICKKMLFSKNLFLSAIIFLLLMFSSLIAINKVIKLVIFCGGILSSYLINRSTIAELKNSLTMRRL